MKVQSNQRGARSSTLSAQGGVYGQRTAQMNAEISGYQRQITSLDEQIRLMGEELAGMKTLNERGYAPTSKVRTTRGTPETSTTLTLSDR